MKAGQFLRGCVKTSTNDYGQTSTTAYGHTSTKFPVQTSTRKNRNVLAMDIHLQFSTMDKHLQAIMDKHLQAIMDKHLQIGMANAHRSTHF